MNNLKILIVEDESLIALELSQTITALGYHEVEYVTTPSMAREVMKTTEINLIIMDINLNTTLTGIELYQEFNCSLPIIYITAYRDDKTITKAISTKPLGYLIKPINDDELKALLKLAKYTITDNSTIIKLNSEYIFHSKEEKLFYKNKFVNLGKKELKLLKLLLNGKETIISFNIIEDEIWKNQIVTPSAIRTLIYRLRSKLGHQFIETEFNYGIKLIIPNIKGKKF